MNASGTQRVAMLSLTVPPAEHQPGSQVAAKAETGFSPVPQPDNLGAPTLARELIAIGALTLPPYGMAVWIK